MTVTVYTTGNRLELGTQQKRKTLVHTSIEQVSRQDLLGIRARGENQDWFQTSWAQDILGPPWSYPTKCMKSNDMSAEVSSNSNYRWTSTQQLLFNE